MNGKTTSITLLKAKSGAYLASMECDLGEGQRITMTLLVADRHEGHSPTVPHIEKEIFRKLSKIARDNLAVLEGTGTTAQAAGD